MNSLLDPYNANKILHSAEIIKDRLYFATIDSFHKLRPNHRVHFFQVDDKYVYESFYEDFGPLNLAMLYRYCCKLNNMLKMPFLSRRPIVQCTTSDQRKRVNSAFLIGSYAIIYLKKTPEQVQHMLGIFDRQAPKFIYYRDASVRPSTFHLSLSKCLSAMYKALQNNLFDFKNFDVEGYEYYEKVENGDLNWIIPHKILAFCGPHNRSKNENGYPLHSPESYFAYFKEKGVSTIVRLNKKIYDAQRFVDDGFEHKDLFFVDGSTPSDAIMREFLSIAENAKGAIAVHCKAGLGRTGTLIACYIMKHYRFTAAEAIAWIRICRPGSIIGLQQHWLENKESYLWLQSCLFQSKIGNANNNNINVGGGSLDNGEEDSTEETSKADDTSSELAPSEEESMEETTDTANANNAVNRILSQVDKINLQESRSDSSLEDVEEKFPDKKILTSEEEQLNNNLNNNESNLDQPDGEGNITQGDQLNRIKALRRHPRSATSGAVVVEEVKPQRRASSQPFRVLSSSSTSAPVGQPSPLKPVRISRSGNPANPPGHSAAAALDILAKKSPASPRRSARVGSLSSSNTKSHSKSGIGRNVLPR